MRTVVDSARATLAHHDGERLRARLCDLSKAAGTFGYNDVAVLALRAAALCDLAPLQVSLLAALLDDIEAAHAAHILTSTSSIGSQAMSGTRQFSDR